jgi:hypothetical protein
LGDSDLSNKFKEQFECIDQDLAGRQKDYLDEAMRLGYTREVIHTAGASWIQAASIGSLPPSSSTALESIKAFSDSISALSLGPKVERQNRILYSQAFVFAASTGSAFIASAGLITIEGSLLSLKE